jgi:hypothetical protein
MASSCSRHGGAAAAGTLGTGLSAQVTHDTTHGCPCPVGPARCLP